MRDSEPSLYYDSQNYERGGFLSTLRMCHEYWNLITLLVNRDLTIRYKRSLLGVWWTLLNPLLVSMVLFFVFDNVFRFQMVDGASFAPYLLSGILVFSFFSQGLTSSADAVANGASILTKVSVPARIFAIAATISQAVNFLVGLIPLMIVNGLAVNSFSFWSPLSLFVVLCLTMFITGLALIVSTLYVRFDDTRSIVSLGILMLTYLTPIFYPKTILSEPVLHIVNLNPLTSYLDFFRWTFGEGAVLTFYDVIYMFGSAVVVLWVGTTIFARTWPRTIAML